jgi:hypothetical protein
MGQVFDWTYWGLMGRMVIINVVPFFLVFHLVMLRRKQLAGEHLPELNLIAGEIKIVGVLGYFVILSTFFFSIPVLQYMDTKPGYDILLVEPDGYTVFLMALISFSLVVFGIYLREKKKWAYWAVMVLIGFLVCYAFFAVLEMGLFASIPVVVFTYLLYRLTRPSLRKELGLSNITERFSKDRRLYG